MYYHADGLITFKRSDAAAAVNRLLETDIFDYVSRSEFDSNGDIEGYYFGTDDLRLFCEEDLIKGLRSVSDFVVSGRLVCNDDYGSYWRYVYEDGYWYEENGMITFKRVAKFCK